MESAECPWLPAVLWPIICAYAWPTPRERLAELLAQGSEGVIVVSCEILLGLGERTRLSIEPVAYGRLHAHIQNVGPGASFRELTLAYGDADELWAGVLDRCISRDFAWYNSIGLEAAFEPGHWFEDELERVLSGGRHRKK